MQSMAEQLQAWAKSRKMTLKPIKGGYKEPLIYLNVRKDVLNACGCTRYGHPFVPRKVKDFRPDALRTSAIELLAPIPIAGAAIPISEQDQSYADMVSLHEEYGVAFNAVV